MNFDAIAGRYSYRAGESYPKVSRGERTTHPARPRSRSRPATRHSRPVAARRGRRSADHAAQKVAHVRPAAHL